MSSRPEIASVEEVYRGRLFSVKHVRAIYDGREVVREVVEHPGSVAVVALDEDGRFLLVTQYRVGVDEITLEIPAGTLERGESPEECALREVEEETGYRARELRLIAKTYTAPGYSSETLYIYKAEAARGSGTRHEPDENIKVVKMSADEVLKAIRENEINDLKSIAALLLYIYSTSGISGVSA
ncbi:MAG: NUDIX hydrolase [Nitrososphaerota archaeon]